MTNAGPKPSRSRGLTRRATDPGVVFAASIIVGLAISAYAGPIPQWVPALYLIASVVSFIVYGLDKRRSERNAWRIPEATMHAINLAFGWPGGLAGQQFFRHKTRKLSFQIVFWMIGFVHLLAWVYIITQTTWLRG